MANNFWELLKPDWTKFPKLETDQRDNVAPPPLQKEYPAGAELIDLVAPDLFSIGNLSFRKVIGLRKSRRKYQSWSLSLEELSYLLWATQGIKQDQPQNKRTVPSGGNRHPFETYLFISNVKGIKPGLYRYLPFDHKLLFIRNTSQLADEVAEACLGNQFVREAAALVVWTAIPYRTEWRYGPLSYKLVAIDAGHICQNLYLASESIGYGTCAIAAYDQQKWDELLKIDGVKEFTIYMAPVGKVDP